MQASKHPSFPVLSKVDTAIESNTEGVVRKKMWSQMRDVVYIQLIEAPASRSCSSSRRLRIDREPDQTTKEILTVSSLLSLRHLLCLLRRDVGSGICKALAPQCSTCAKFIISPVPFIRFVFIYLQGFSFAAYSTSNRHIVRAMP
jgi:hypothetical protein